jgi:hypothetical protein
MEGKTVYSRIDKGKSWQDNTINAIYYPPYRCPAKVREPDDFATCYTQYLGIAGIGENAAFSSTIDPTVGVFSFSRQTKLADIVDGSSHTMMVSETTLNNAPWLAGGLTTVRSADPTRLPYLGKGGQFGSLHRQNIEWRSLPVTNILLVDGSVHSLRESINPEVFAALTTIAGSEPIRLDW